MKKTVVKIVEQNRKYADQGEAREWAIKLLEAGVVFMEISEEKTNEK